MVQTTAQEPPTYRTQDCHSPTWTREYAEVGTQAVDRNNNNNYKNNNKKIIRITIKYYAKFHWGISQLKISSCLPVNFQPFLSILYPKLFQDKYFIHVKIYRSIIVGHHCWPCTETHLTSVTNKMKSSELCTCMLSTYMYIHVHTVY